jgi:voltage-gated potassium channel Kch
VDQYDGSLQRQFDVTGRNLSESLLRIVVIVGGLSLLYAALPFRGDRWWVGMVVGSAAIVGVLPMAIRRIRRVLKSDRPLFEAIEALVLLVVTFVLGFSAVYYGIDRQQGQFNGIETKLDAVYFTTTTLATVGYGDISPSGQLARGLAMLQMVLDVVLLVLIVKAMTGAVRHRSHDTKQVP